MYTDYIQESSYIHIHGVYRIYTKVGIYNIQGVYRRYTRVGIYRVYTGYIKINTF